MGEYFTTEQVAEMLKIQKNTLEHWRLKGKGPKAVKVGGRLVRYERGEVEKWINGEQENGR